MSPKIYPDVIKKQTLVTLPPAATVQDAVDLMSTHQIGAVVITETDRLVGIFTERDVVFRVVHHKLDPSLTLLEQVMTPDPSTISVDANPVQALQIMQTNRFRHLPVLEGHKIVGMVSIRDLFAVVNDQLERDLRQTESFLFGSGYSSA